MNINQKISSYIIIGKLLFLIYIITFSITPLYAKHNTEYYHNKLEKIYFSFDKKEYSKYINSIDKALKYTSDSLELLYYSALAKHNYGKILYNNNSKLAYKLFDKASQNLETGLKIFYNKSPKNKLIELEFNILLSDILAKKSSLETLSALFTGKLAYKYFKKAWSIDSNNTKCRLVASIQLMHLPPLFGGDKNRARQLLFSITTSSNIQKKIFLINWASKSEIYAYIAQLALLENKNKEFKKYSNLALKLQSNYGFVLYDLRKQINKK